MWKELNRFGMGPPSGGDGQQPVLRRNSPLLWILIIGAILIYTQTAGSLFGPMDQSHVSRMAVSPEEVTGAFSLIDHTGTPRTQADFLGRHTLIYFGFTWCPDVCPSAMLVMAEVVEDLEAQGKSVQPLFITVDPQRDTVQKLADYAAQLPGLIALTGSEDAVNKALDNFGIYRRSQAGGPEDAGYRVDHAPLFYLMGLEGTLVDYYLPNQGPTQIALEIERSLRG